MQWEVGTCCYLLHRFLGPQCPLVEALWLQVVDTIDEDFALFCLQMGTNHRCTAFTYDVSCIMGNYLYACVKVSETVSLTDPGGRIQVSFKYLRDKISHSCYVGRPIPPSLGTLLLEHDSDRVAVARCVREPSTGPANSGTDGGSSLGAVR